MKTARLLVALMITWAVVVLPQYVFAAPFCVVTQYGKRCWYHSYDACLRAAGQAGACVINQEEVRPPSGKAPFCVVTQYETRCWYYNARACREVAASSGGACVVNPNR